jgi:hypothetical protein
MNSLESRRAIEAVRSGVPNRDAVRVLGCHQPHAQRLFKEQLEKARAASWEDGQVRGLLVKGSFGAGKSHLLEFFHSLAFEANFVCSRVVISKETPLYDAQKVFAAAMESAVAPGLHGQLIHEIAHQLNPASQAHAELYRWAASPGCGLSPIFPATLRVHEGLSNDPELVEEIAGFWSGEKLSIQRVKQGLKLIGSSDAFQVRAVPVRELGPQRFLFASRLIRAAGYSGWVIFFDEVELVGRYSLLQRAGAYAELAKWIGLAPGLEIPGLTSVLAMTDDFALAVLDEKRDNEVIGQRLRAMGGERELLAPRAEIGMRVIEREAVALEMPDSQALSSTYQSLRSIYQKAYDWEPPGDESQPAFSDKPMRSHVRRWVNTWDIRRIYGAEGGVDMVDEAVKTNYTEERELEQPREESDEQAGTAALGS